MDEIHIHMATVAALRALSRLETAINKSDLTRAQTEVKNIRFELGLIEQEARTRPEPGQQIAQKG